MHSEAQGFVPVVHPMFKVYHQGTEAGHLSTRYSAQPNTRSPAHLAGLPPRCVASPAPGRRTAYTHTHTISSFPVPPSSPCGPVGIHRRFSQAALPRTLHGVTAERAWALD